MTILRTMLRGARASVTLDNINISMDETGSPRTSTGRGRVDLVGGLGMSYEKIYLTQIWVNAIVNKLSRGIGRLPLKTFAADGNERDRVRSGPLYELMRRPYEGCSPFQFKSSVIGNLAVYGNCIAVKVRDRPGDPPIELIPSSFAYWKVIPGKVRPVDWYVFQASNGERLVFRPEDVVHWRWWGPGADTVGPSPLEALKRTLKVEDAAQRAQIAAYENGARPQGAFSVPQDVKKETAEFMRAQINETYGGVDSNGKIALLVGGAKWEPMSFDMGEAGIIAARQLTREEAAAAYDMPPPVIQILDKATFSNITEQHLMLYMDTMGPWTTLFEEGLQVQLIDQEPAYEGQFVEFDLFEVLKGDPLKRMEAYSRSTHMSLNEKRERENMPRVNNPLADALWINPGMIPIGEGIDTDAYLPSSQAPGASAAADVRCPTCDGLLAKNVTDGDFHCRRCKIDVKVSAGEVLTAAIA